MAVNNEVINDSQGKERMKPGIGASPGQKRDEGN